MPPQNPRSRIAGSLGASVFSNCVTILTQLFVIPVFLKYWDKETFGEWLVVSTVPAFLALADAGFGTFGGNLLAKAGLQQKNGTYLRLFSTVYFTSVGVSLLLIIISVLGILTLPILTILHLRLLSRHAASASLVLLSVSAGCAMLNQFFIGLYRALNRFARGTYALNLVRLAQFLFTCSLAPFTKDITLLSLAIAGTQLFATLGIQIDLYRLNALNRPSLNRIRPALAVYIFKRSFSLLLFPVGNTLLFPTMSLLVNAILGPASLVTFNALRTLTRTGTQFVGILHAALAPEITGLLFRKDSIRAQRLYFVMMLTTLASVSLLVCVIFFAGPWVLRVWTKNSVHSDSPQLLLFALPSAISGIWMGVALLLRMLNHYAVIAWSYLFAATTALALGYVLCPRFGISGAVLGMILADALQLCSVIYVLRTLNLFQERGTSNVNPLWSRMRILTTLITG